MPDKRRGSIVPLLMLLPPETLDEIASYIDLHADLVSFALASRACAKLIIPRQTQYRIIRVRHATPILWAHLARRADLARNIREVHIVEKHNRLASERFPTTLIDKDADGAQVNISVEAAVLNMCKALGHMKLLHTFTWSNSDGSNPLLPLVNPMLEMQIMYSLVQCPSLEHLGLIGPFACGPSLARYPLWFIKNLTSISLSGRAWVQESHAPYLVAMLQRSPNLKHLDLPIEFTRLHMCRFPRLTHAKLTLQSGAVPAVDASHIKFIEAHPSITSLVWHPLSEDERKLTFKASVLPNLKMISTAPGTLNAICVDEVDSSRPLEYLDIARLTQHHLPILMRLNAYNTVRKLVVQSFDDFDTLDAIPDILPDLTALQVPCQYHLPVAPYGPVTVTLDQWLDLLSRLPNLEVFRGKGLWTAVGFDDMNMHNVICEVAALCPNLKQLDHRAQDEKRSDVRTIKIIREQIGEETSVRYEVCKAKERRWFQDIDWRLTT